MQEKMVNLSTNSLIASLSNSLISLLICTYNRSDLVLCCLDSIVKMTDPGCNFEVIVIDNNSTDNTFRRIEEFAIQNPQLDLHLYKENKQGLSFARNLAIKMAQGDLLVFLDDDAIVDKNYLLAYRTYYEKNRFFCMGSKILPWFKDNPFKIPSWFNKSNWGVLSMLDMGEQIKKVSYPNFPYGGNLAVTQKLFKKFGNFDEAMGRKGKKLSSNMEIDFMLRLQKASIPIYYVPDATIFHLVQKERVNVQFFLKRFYAQGRSDAYLFSKDDDLAYRRWSVHQRVFEILCAPLLFFYRKALKHEDFFKPILRIAYHLGYLYEKFNFFFGQQITAKNK